MKAISVLLLFFVLALSGCVTPPSPEAIKNADYGGEPPTAEAAQAQIHARYEPYLYDPSSVVYKMGMTYKGWIPVKGGYLYGYWVHFTYNAKNQLGGYVGAKGRAAFFRDGKLIGVYEVLTSGKKIPEV